ncbi:MAG: shikimate kinase AroK [Arsenophonus sp.]|nr:MAG: shikimate kinase AroK [Arsenophonus sp.]
MIDKKNIFLIGPMGAGKSTIGKYLSQKLNMDFFDSDEEIEKRSGADLSWIFDLEGEEGFRKRENKIIKELTEKEKIILATGGGSIQSKEIRNRLSSRGIVVYLHTSIKKQILRTKHNKKRPLLNQNIHADEIIKKLAVERNPLYQEIADITLYTDNQSVKIITNQIIKLLSDI